MHLAPLIRDLAVILGVAGLVNLVFQRIRQPVVLGYLIAGLLVGPHTPPGNLISDLPNVRIWAEIGVIFLMFSLGLEFSFRKLIRVGVSAGGTAGFEVFTMMALGFGCGRLMGWNISDSIFLGAALSISSTTIIIKSLQDLGLKTRRFAEMIFGILIVEDLLAILVMVGLSTFAVGDTLTATEVAVSAGKLILVVGSWVLVGYFLVPRFMRYVGQLGSDETLTLLSIGMCFILVVAAAAFEYSVALGAFIMGSILAESRESTRIEELLHPLRDLFAAIFFVSVGMLLDPRILVDHFGEVLILVSLTVFGKILTTSIGALVTGQSLRNSLQVGFGLAQIGEFSFIIAGVGYVAGVVSEFLYPLLIAVSIVTAFTTPYMIRASLVLAERLEQALPLPIRGVLNRYASWVQERRADEARRTVFYRAVFRWLLNGLVVSLCFILVGEWLSPLLADSIESSLIRNLTSWGISILISAPFIWGMYTALASAPKNGTHGTENITLFVSRVLTVVWIGLLSLEFFSAPLALGLTALVAALLFVRFYKQLESSYHWFEKQFLSSFKVERRGAGKWSPGEMVEHLAPWDAHLLKLKVHANSEISGRRLCDIDFRARFGLSIVAIQRGQQVIIAPGSTSQIFPGDELLVLGLDEEVERIRPISEGPKQDLVPQDLSAYELRPVLLHRESRLSGKTIRASQIRLKFNALIVGVERGNQRFVNPDSEFVLKGSDTLWVVGDLVGTESLEKEARAPG